MEEKAKEMAKKVEENENAAKEELPDKDLWKWIGVPEVYKRNDRSYKYQEPQGTALKREEYPPIATFHQKFYDRYVTNQVYPNHNQKFDSRVCTWKDPQTLKPCTFHQPHFRFVNLRVHFLSHYDDSHEKYVCSRCGHNYGKYDHMLKHGNRGRCRIPISAYPPLKFFIQEALQFHPEQEKDSLVCFKCKKEFANTFLTQRHFYSCIHFNFPCYKCSGTYSDYASARAHFDECDGSTKKVNVAYHLYHIDKPTEADDRTWTDDEMLKHIEEIALPKIEEVLKAFPDPRAYFGQTGIPEQRFKVHRQFQAVFKRKEANPYIENNELILARFWYRSQALRYEYLLQFHTSTPDGQFYERIGHLVNRHHIVEPKEAENDETKAPVYVYIMPTRRQYQPSQPGDLYSDDDDEEEKKENNLVAPSSTSTSQSTRKRKKPDDDDSKSQHQSKPKRPKKDPNPSTTSKALKQPKLKNIASTSTSAKSNQEVIVIDDSD